MNWAVRFVACVLSAALVLSAPGPGVARAVAQVVPVSVNAPVGGVSAAGGAVSFGASGAAFHSPSGAGMVPGAALAPALASFGSLSPELRGTGSALVLPRTAIGGLAPSAASLRTQGISVREGIRASASGGETRMPVPGVSPLRGASPVPSVSPALSAETPPLPSAAGLSKVVARHFAALRRAFGLKADANLSSGGSALGSLGAGRTVRTARSSVGAPRSDFEAPLSAARLGLAKPRPLVLEKADRGLKLSVRVAGVHGPEEAYPMGAPAGTNPAPKADPGSKKNGWFGLGKVAMMFIASLVVAQVGVEALGAAMPTLVQKTFGDFTAVAQLAIVSSFASIIGRQLGPLVVRKLGLKKTYLYSTVLKLVSVSALAGLLATGNMTLGMMTAFYAVNGFLGGVSLTAMESIPPALVGRDPAKLERFWTWEQTILEIVGIAGPIATGAVVAGLGFMPALIAFPVAMAGSLAIVFFSLKIPEKLDRINAVPAESVPAAGAARGFVGKLIHGAKLVWSSKPLRYAFLAYSFFVMLNPFLYTLLGPAFGLRLVGAANTELATGVIGWLTGLYSFGGLLGGFLMMAAQKRTNARKAKMRAEYEAKNGKVSDDEWAARAQPWEGEVLRKSMLKWMLLGTAGLAGIATLAFPLPMLGQVVTLPGPLSWLGNLTLQAGALILFGMAQVVSVLKLRSFFQSRVPSQNDMADAMGFFGSASLAISTAGLMALKYLFQSFEGFAPFAYIAYGMIPLAALYLFLRWRLDRSTRPAA